MRVYRVEHETERRDDGRSLGPYSYGVERKDLVGLAIRIAEAHCDDDHPSPYRDGIDIWSDDLCGFKSVHELHKWFDGWTAELHFAGYVIGEYEIPKNRVKFGISQIAFSGEEAKLIATWPL